MGKAIFGSLVCILSVAFSLSLTGQVTTSGIKGRVVDEKNDGLAGATVLAVHTPSGTEYGVSTTADGRFSISNMRVGGPYRITISFVGYKPQVFDDVILSLGNVADFNAALIPAITSLNEVVVSAGKNDIINSRRTGAAVNVPDEVVVTVPTIARGLKDFTRISPLANIAGNGTSFAGTNNRYNQFAIDGIVDNDVFGLAASGTNGGQTGIEPISLDAIEEFQISIAPYDVRQGGFTGGGINAITKSGTNTFRGSLYTYGNNQSVVGTNDPISDTTRRVAQYRDYQAGITLGGPVVTNKLFFFASGEITRKVTPVAALPGTSGSQITLDEINRVLSVLNRVAPSYDPGGYLDFNDETKSNKALLKLNWNMSNRQKLILRYSYTYGENIDNSRTSTALRFYNNGIFFPSTTNTVGLELNSIFGDHLSNRLMLGYTGVRDNRKPLGSSFPTVLINLTNGRSITLGSEFSSVANKLNQDIYSLSDDFSIFSGRHSITVGTHDEFYSFYNLFVQNIFGNFAYNSLANFETIGTANEVAPTFYGISYSFDPTDNPFQTNGASKWNALQLGLYAQDEYQAAPGLVITAGLRLDLPVFPVKPEANTLFNSDYAHQNVSTGVLPTSKILWAPRLGFNWDPFRDKKTQVRGGTGIFTGRIPFVWISNEFTNNGQLIGTYSVGSTSPSASPITDPAGLKFIADPYSQKLASDLGKTPGRGAINVVDPDLKFPQVFRTNLALDRKLPWGLTATIEGVFSKTFNNVLFKNLNRQIDTTFSFTGVDNRPRFISGRINPAYDEIIKFENSNRGYSYNLIASLRREFQKGIMAMVSYTFGRSLDVNSGTSSVAYSNWRFVNNVDGLNDLPLTFSNYDPGSRITGLISYRLSYRHNLMSTMISLFYNGQSGQPVSYIYNGDLNNDGTVNDLIYIPAKQSDINLVPITGAKPQSVDQQWAALDAFISGDRYLSTHRGEYAERNGARLPFQNELDLKLMQAIGFNAGSTSNRFEISLDILNLANLISGRWGRSLFLTNQQFALINYKGQAAGSPSTPTFTFQPAGLTNGKPWSVDDFNSRWRMQIGLRYIFN